MLISAATYGRSGPTHTASLTYGENLSLFSRYFGAKSVPSARRPTSLARSTILRWPAPDRQGRPVAPRLRARLGEPEAEVDQPALRPGAVLDADHHVGEDGLPDPRRGEEVGRPALLQVVEDRGGALRAVDSEPRHDGLGVREDVVAHPRHRQVRQDLLVALEALERRGVPRGHAQVPVGEHRAFGDAGGPRGVADDGDVVRPAAAELVVEMGRVADLELSAALRELSEAHEGGLAVTAHPARVVVDDGLEPRALGLDVQQFVHLLLVLDHREPGLRVVEDVLHLLLDRVLVDRDRHAAEGLGGHDGPVWLREVVPGDGGLVTR